jgi:hypothetical protein
VAARSGEPVTAEQLDDLEFAWGAVRAVKSNAILLASGGASVGIGMGQVNRVDSCKLAVTRAGDRAKGSVAASDAFFPFPDGLQVLIDAGVAAVVQPAVRCATRRSSRRPTPPGSPCTSPVPAIFTTELLADHPHLIPAVGEIRWREWGRRPNRWSCRSGWN